MRAYRIIIFTVWALTLVIAALLGTSSFFISFKSSMYLWTPYVLSLTFVISGCNISIWRKIQLGGVASHQQNRNTQNKRLTGTLLFVSVLTLVSWLPLIIFNCLIYVYGIQIPLKFYHMVNFINYSSSFANPVVYVLRMPEFREALELCSFGRQTAADMRNLERRRNKKASPLTSATELRKLRTDTSNLQLAFEQEVLDTKL